MTARGVVVVGIAILLAACRSVHEAKAYRVDIDLTTPSDASAGGSSSDDFAVRAVFWLTPGFLRAEHRVLTRGQANAPDDLGPPALSLTDLVEGVRWETRADGSRFLRSLNEIEYTGAEERRALLVDYIDLCVRVRAVRDAAGAARFLGRGEIELGPAEGMGFYTARIYEEPGVLWEIRAVTSDGERDLPLWARSALCLQLLGMSRRRAADVAVVLGGTPLAVGVNVSAAGGLEVVARSKVVAVEALDVLPDGLGLPAEGLDAANWLRARPGAAARWIAGLRDPSVRPPAVTALGTLLALEASADAWSVEDLAAISASCDDPELHRHVARLLLRRQGASAVERFRRDLRGDRCVRALASADAMIAESHSESAAVVLDILRRRAQFIDLPPAVVTSWAVRHLRGLSSYDLLELAARVGPFWDDDAATGGEALAALAGEADFWLRSWNGERRQGTVVR